MSGNKREQERAELHNTIWALANELRGSVDGWVNIPLRRSRLSGKMETTCPDRRKPL